jgi:hypothetical protein
MPATAAAPGVRSGLSAASGLPVSGEPGWPGSPVMAPFPR